MRSSCPRGFRPTVLAFVVLMLAAIAVGPRLEAQTAREPAPVYTRTVTEQEAIDHISGAEKLDEADPAYCEKARDICLLALCGATTREKTRAACWEQCTQRQFDRCKESQEKRQTQ